MRPNSTASSRPVSLRQVAAAAGLSPAGTSLALRGDPSISEDTRRRVRQVAQRLGYRPDHALNQVMSAVRRAGLVRPAEPVLLVLSAEHRSSYVLRLAEALEAIAPAQGWIPSRWEIDATHTPARLGRAIKARGIRALLVLPLSLETDLSTLPWGRLCAVAFSQLRRPDGLSKVLPDHAGNARLALDSLVHHGARRIGFAITATMDRRTEGVKRHGFLAAVERIAGLEVAPPLVLSNPEEGSALRRWLKRHQPQAVIIGDDALAKTFAQNGADMHEPRLASVDAAESAPGIARVGQQVSAIADAGARLLAGMLANGQQGLNSNPLSVVVRGQWQAEAARV